MIALNRIWGAVLVLLLGTLASSSSASAGYPYWGGGHGYHHRHGYGALSFYTPGVWGRGYGWSGYHGLGYTRSLSLGYRSWYARPIGYSSFYANYYLPSATYYAPYAPQVINYAPAYCAPVYSPPTCCDDVYAFPPVDVVSDCDNCLSAVESPLGDVLEVSPVSIPARDASRSMLVNTPLSTLELAAIPDSLLASADAVFRAGGYRQAATAYAQLHVRYGSSEQIFERRFVAQVACGDFDQAAVVLASAQGAGFPIQHGNTDDSQWSPILADQTDLVGGWTERLAQHALQAADQRESSEMMATWLNLTGQPQRAGLFLELAERLTLEPFPPTPPTIPHSTVVTAEELPPPRSEAALVSLED